MKKPLHGCVLCRDCKGKIVPKSIGILSIRDMMALGYSGCSKDNAIRLTEADRKCPDYNQAGRYEVER